MESLSPRFDLFRFEFPKDWVPQEIQEKYQRILNQDNGVIIDPIQYLNESIQGIKIPGISDLIIEQEQVSRNVLTSNQPGKINIEAFHVNAYPTTTNLLKNIEHELTITMRQNQGLMNYFIIYETIIYHLHAGIKYNRGEDVFTVKLLNEKGTPSCNINYYQPLLSKIDGIEFNYSKMERGLETFDLSFNFNRVDFDFIP